MLPIRNLVLIVNPDKSGAIALAEVLLRQAKEASVAVTVIQKDAQALSPGFLKGSDAGCTIGGDGTLLSVVEEAVREQTPILGINCGKLGFMTAFSAAEAETNFTQFLQGHCAIADRWVLKCESACKAGVVWALNDVVVKVDAARLTHFTVSAEAQWVNRYASDGLIFCTPTGSTAYNLSAGGPLIDPEAEVIAMTPICPHTLSNRTVIFNRHTVLKIALSEEIPVRVSRDGRICFADVQDFPLTIKVASRFFKLVHLPDYSYYQMVRAKLGWGQT